LVVKAKKKKKSETTVAGFLIFASIKSITNTRQTYTKDIKTTGVHAQKSLLNHA
jgi:hypothetical protein